MPDPTPDEIDQITALIHAQAEKLTIPEIQEKVAAAAEGLRVAALAIDEADYDRQPSNDEWTPRFALNHVVSWQLHDARFILYVALTGELPMEEEVILPPDRDGMLAKLNEAFESLYIHLADATPDYFLDTKWPHKWFGELNWREWLYFLRLHSMDHTRQLNEMREGL
jgi:hypothetical protein